MQSFDCSDNFAVTLFAAKIKLLNLHDICFPSAVSSLGNIKKTYDIEKNCIKNDWGKCFPTRGRGIVGVSHDLLIACVYLLRLDL